MMTSIETPLVGDTDAKVDDTDAAVVQPPSKKLTRRRMIGIVVVFVCIIIVIIVVVCSAFVREPNRTGVAAQKQRVVAQDAKTSEAVVPNQTTQLPRTSQPKTTRPKTSPSKTTRPKTSPSKTTRPEMTQSKTTLYETTQSRNTQLRPTQAKKTTTTSLEMHSNAEKVRGWTSWTEWSSCCDGLQRSGRACAFQWRLFNCSGDRTRQRSCVDSSNCRNRAEQLISACSKIDSTFCTEALREGADVSMTTRVGARYTALHVAAQTGKSEQVKSLLFHGADPNTRTASSNSTALMMAAYRGQLAVVGLLLTYGARVQESQKDGWTALLYSVVGGHAEVVVELIACGANKRVRTSSGESAEDLAEDKKTKMALQAQPRNCSVDTNSK